MARSVQHSSFPQQSGTDQASSEIGVDPDSQPLSPMQAVPYTPANISLKHNNSNNSRFNAASEVTPVGTNVTIAQKRIKLNSAMKPPTTTSKVTTVTQVQSTSKSAPTRLYRTNQLDKSLSKPGNTLSRSTITTAKNVDQMISDGGSDAESDDQADISSDNVVPNQDMDEHRNQDHSNEHHQDNHPVGQGDQEALVDLLNKIGLEGVQVLLKKASRDADGDRSTAKKIKGKKGEGRRVSFGAVEHQLDDGRFGRGTSRCQSSEVENGDDITLRDDGEEGRDSQETGKDDTSIHRTSRMLIQGQGTWEEDVIAQYQQIVAGSMENREEGTFAATEQRNAMRAEDFSRSLKAFDGVELAKVLQTYQDIVNGHINTARTEYASLAREYKDNLDKMRQHKDGMQEALDEETAALDKFAKTLQGLMQKQEDYEIELSEKIAKARAKWMKKYNEVTDPVVIQNAIDDKELEILQAMKKHRDARLVKGRLTDQSVGPRAKKSKKL